MTRFADDAHALPLRRMAAWAAIALFACGSPAADDSSGGGKATGGGGTGGDGSTIIGPEGGEVWSEDGRVRLYVPPEALTVPVSFSIAPAVDAAPGAVGLPYELSPSGTTFAVPASLSFDVAGRDLSEEPLEIAREEEGVWRELPLALFDEDSQQLSSYTMHLSKYALKSRTEPDPCLCDAGCFAGACSYAEGMLESQCRCPLGGVRTRPYTFLDAYETCTGVQASHCTPCIRACCDDAEGWLGGGGKSCMCSLFGLDAGERAGAANECWRSCIEAGLHLPEPNEPPSACVGENTGLYVTTPPVTDGLEQVIVSSKIVSVDPANGTLGVVADGLGHSFGGLACDGKGGLYTIRFEFGTSPWRMVLVHWNGESSSNLFELYVDLGGSIGFENTLANCDDRIYYVEPSPTLPSIVSRPLAQLEAKSVFATATSGLELGAIACDGSGGLYGVGFVSGSPAYTQLVHYQNGSKTVLTQVENHVLWGVRSVARCGSQVAFGAPLGDAAGALHLFDLTTGVTSMVWQGSWLPQGLACDDAGGFYFVRVETNPVRGYLMHFDGAQTEEIGQVFDTSAGWVAYFGTSIARCAAGEP